MPKYRYTLQGINNQNAVTRRNRNYLTAEKKENREKLRESGGQILFIYLNVIQLYLNVDLESTCIRAHTNGIKMMKLVIIFS